MTKKIYNCHPTGEKDRWIKIIRVATVEMLKPFNLNGLLINNYL